MDICPICQSECTVEEYCETVGLVEKHTECPNGCWSHSYSYGNTEIHIGDFMTGYSYTTSAEEREKISNAINVLTNYYKIEHDKSKEGKSSCK